MFWESMKLHVLKSYKKHGVIRRYGREWTISECS